MKDAIRVPREIGVYIDLTGNTTLTNTTNAELDTKQSLSIWGEKIDYSEPTNQGMYKHYRVHNTTTDNTGTEYEAIPTSVDSLRIGRCYVILNNIENVEEALKDLSRYHIYYGNDIFLNWKKNELTGLWDIRSKKPSRTTLSTQKILKVQRTQ